MKKQLLSLLTAATMLFATSCSDEELTYESGNKQNVTFKVEMEGAGASSRTINDGEGNAIEIGHGKMAKQLFYAVYESGKEACLKEGTVAMSSSGTTNVVIPLVNGLEFDLVFLAYNPKNNVFDLPEIPTIGDDGLCADVDLTNLTLKSGLKANQEAYDAFYHVVKNYKTQTNSTTPVELHHMFAQLNVATEDDDLKYAKQLGVEITESAIEVTGVPTTFDARYETVDDERTVSFSRASILKHIDSSVENGNEKLTVNGENFNYLAMAYVLAGAESSLHDIKVSFYRDEQTKEDLVNTRSIASVPLQRNYRTNITGFLLTQQEAFDITLEKGYGDREHNVSVGDVVVVADAETLLEVIENAKPDVPVEIQLEDNVDLNDLISQLSSRATEDFYGLTIGAQKNIILDLNNHTLSYNSSEQNGGLIKNNGTLTIKNGTVTYTYEGKADQSNSKGNYAINNTGTLVVDANINAVVNTEDEKFQHAFYAINTSGKTTINGGKIHNEHQYAIRQWVDSEANSSDITINGGEIEGVRAIWIQLPNSDTSKAPKGSLTVTDGKLTGRCQEENEDYYLALYAYSYGNQMKNFSINISGGTFDGDIALTGGRVGAKVDVEKLTVTGGTFSGNSKGIYSYADDDVVKGNMVITGGTFTEAAKNGTNEVLLGEKYGFEKNEDGNYDVVRGDYLSLGEFVEAVIAANGVYDGQNALVKINVESGDARTSDSEFVPNRLQKYSNPEVYYAQYQRFSELTDVKISNVNFEFVPAAVTVVDVWNTSGATTTAENINGELQFLNKGTVTLTNCTFKMVSVSPISAPALTVEGCSFENLQAYAIKDVNATTVAINNNHFTKCNGGFWFNAAPTSLTAKGNEFSQVGRRGAIQFSAADENTISTKDYTSTTMNITGNKVNDGAFLWQLNNTVTAEQIEAILDKKNNTYETAFVQGSIDPSPVAAIGNDTYKTLQDAMNQVQEDETIQLLKDVTFTIGADGSTNGISYTRGLSFILDLNKKTVTSNLGNNALRFKIGDGNDVTNTEVTIQIKNGKIISGADNWCAISAATADNSGNQLIMNLENLEIENSKAGDFAIKSWAGAVVNANNVKVTSSYGGSFYATGGEMVLDNCTAIQTGLHTAPYNSMAVAVSGNGKMTVNSGNYSTTPAAAADGNNQGTSHGSWCAGVMNSGGTLIIEGGTFANGNYGDDASATAARGLLLADTGGNIQIQGGTFNALKSIIDIQNNLGDASKNPSVTLTGGTFSADPSNSTNSNLIKVAEGYEIKANEDDTYIVAAKETEE